VPRKKISFAGRLTPCDTRCEPPRAGPRRRRSRNPRRRLAPPAGGRGGRDGEPADLQLGALARAQLEHRAPGARVPRHDDLRLRGVGQHAARRFTGHLPTVDLVGHPAVALHQLSHERDVRALRRVDLRAPRALERLVPRDRRRDDEARLALVDVPLRELRVGEPRAVPHQLVRQRAADPLEQEGVVRVLEDAPVPLLLDVLQIVARRAARRIVLAHVAEPARELRQSLAVGALADPVHVQVVRRGEHGAREDGDLRLVVETRGGGGSGCGHVTGVRRWEGMMAKARRRQRGRRARPRRAAPGASARTPSRARRGRVPRERARATRGAWGRISRRRADARPRARPWRPG